MTNVKLRVSTIGKVWGKLKLSLRYDLHPLERELQCKDVYTTSVTANMMTHFGNVVKMCGIMAMRFLLSQLTI